MRRSDFIDMTKGCDAVRGCVATSDCDAVRGCEMIEGNKATKCDNIEIGASGDNMPRSDSKIARVQQFAAAALALALFATFTSCGKKDAHSHGAMVPTVTVARPMVDSVVLHHTYPGYVAALQESDIVARVSGMVLAKHYADGDLVMKGAPLFTIESTTYADQLQQAEASLQSAIASNEYNKKNYEAMKKALESDAVSKMDVIQAESALHESEAAIKNARAAVESARTKVGYCTVRAPFTGRVTKADITVGDYVSGDMQPVTVARIFADNQVYVYFSVDNDQYTQIAEARKRDGLDFDRIPVLMGDSIPTGYTGKLDYEAPDVDKSTGTVNLRLLVDNPDYELKSGMYALVSIPYQINRKAVIIKDASIGTDQLGKYVYLVNDSDKVVYNPIKVGELYDDTLRIVESGIAPTDRYVTTALLKVRNGMTVHPQTQAR